MFVGVTSMFYLAMFIYCSFIGAQAVHTVVVLGYQACTRAKFVVLVIYLGFSVAVFRFKIS